MEHLEGTMADPNEVLAASVAFRGQLDDLNNPVMENIVAQTQADATRDRLIRDWATLRNQADDAVDQATELVFNSSNDKLQKAKSSIEDASTQLTTATD